MMPKEVSDAIRVLYEHGYLAKLQLKFMADRLLMARMKDAEAYMQREYEQAGHVIGKAIIKDKEHLLQERSESSAVHYGWQKHALCLTIIRAKPDPETDRRLQEETMRSIAEELSEADE